jgi:hypothetical protein
MSPRSYLLKSAAVLFSVALVSAYIYERSRSDLVPYSGDAGAPAAGQKFMPGPKSAAVWAQAPNSERSRADAQGHSKKGAGDRGAVLIPSTKSAVIFSLNEIRAAGADGAAPRP